MPKKRKSAPRSPKLLIILLILLCLSIALLITINQTQSPLSLSLNQLAAEREFLSKAVQIPASTQTYSYIHMEDQNDILLPNGPMTTEFWLRFDQPVDPVKTYPIIVKVGHYQYPSGETIAPIFYVFHQNNQIIMSLYDSAKQQVFSTQGPISTQTGVWQHVAMTYDGSGLNYFLDGRKTSGSSSGSSHYPLLNSSRPVRIEGWQSYSQNSNETEAISIDELRISNISRYANSFTPSRDQFSPDANTLGLWHFDEKLEDGIGSYFPDESLNNNRAYNVGGFALTTGPIHLSWNKCFDYEIPTLVTPYDQYYGQVIINNTPAPKNTIIKLFGPQHNNAVGCAQIENDGVMKFTTVSTEMGINTGDEVEFWVNNSRMYTQPSPIIFRGNSGPYIQVNLSNLPFPTPTPTPPPQTPRPTPSATPTPPPPSPKPITNIYPTISTTFLPSAVVNRTYKATVTATDPDAGAAANKLTLTAASLPFGFTLGNCSSTYTAPAVKTVCVLSGTPKTAGQSQVTFTAVDVRGGKTIKTLPLRVVSLTDKNPPILPPQPTPVTE